MLDELTQARRRDTAARLTALLDLVAQGVLTAEDVLSDSHYDNESLTHAPARLCYSQLRVTA